MQIKRGDAIFLIRLEETKKSATCQFGQECEETGSSTVSWVGGGNNI